MAADDENFSDVVIAGGGTASLFLAQNLVDHAAGLTVHVLERGEAGRRTGQGVLVHPITQYLFERRHPGHAWDWSGTVRRLREFHGERRVNDLDAGVDGLGDAKRFPSNNLLAGIDGVLVEELDKHPAARLSYRREVVAIDSVQDGWRVTTSTPDGVEVLRCSVLVAADGRDSTLRDSLRLPYETVPFPGRVDILAFPDRREDTPAVSMVQGPGGATTVVDNGMGPNTLIFDMRADGSEPRRPSSLREQAVRRAAVAGLRVGDPAAPLFGASIRSATVACGTWLSRRALVFGDAAHAMHNLGGQGFNLTVQDAVALAPGIADWVAGSDSGLREYEAFRLPYVTEIQARQNRLFAELAAGRHDAADGWFFPLRQRLIEGQDGLYSYLGMEGAGRDA